jgi:alpha-tubulin suppressor-like RCC1 family protein
MPAVVASGSHHSICISRRGELFTWGFGKYGELGQGQWTPLEVLQPKLCPLTQVRIVSVACGASHTLAIGESGSLWSSGKNNRGEVSCHALNSSYSFLKSPFTTGQLGLGNFINSMRLQMVQNLP